jgi:hypothetical protein
MADKCPICYRTLGTWTHDPILLPHGAQYDWLDDTHLIFVADEDDRWYKGFQVICEDEVIELQDSLKDLEEEWLDPSDYTEFSPVNSSGKFQITGKHIKEMRDSVEKLLNELGLSFTDYFNYDEEGNHIIHPDGDKIGWTDPITDATDLQKFQIKYIHIEDLRHFIQALWKETWYNTIYSDHTFVNVRETSDINTGSLNADNLWSYAGIYGVLYSSMGFCDGSATADINFSSNFSFYGEGHITWCPSQHPAGTTSYFNMTTLVLAGGNIGEHTHFQIEDGHYSESGGVTGILPTDPVLWEYYYHTPMPTSLPLPDKPYIWIIITLMDGKAIIYYVGGEIIPTHGIDLGSSPTMDRNIYDDFITFYPTFGGGVIASIRIECECVADSWDNIFSGQPPSIHYMCMRNNTMTTGFGTMKLKIVP